MVDFPIFTLSSFFTKFLFPAVVGLENLFALCVGHPPLTLALFASMPTAKVQPDGVQDVGNPNRKNIQSQFSRTVASNAQLLAKAELYFTAFLSMSDMVSDIVMVVSLSLSLGTCREQTRHRSWDALGC